MLTTPSQKLQKILGYLIGLSLTPQSHHSARLDYDDLMAVDGGPDAIRARIADHEKEINSHPAIGGNREDPNLWIRDDRRARISELEDLLPKDQSPTDPKSAAT